MEKATEALGALALPEIARAEYLERKSDPTAPEGSQILDTLKHASMRCGGYGSGSFSFDITFFDVFFLGRVFGTFDAFSQGLSA